MIKKVVALFIITSISLMIASMHDVHSLETKAQTSDDLWKTEILSSIEDSHYEQLVSAIVIDANTGQILLQTNEDTEFPVGGLTKLMLLYITFEEINKMDNDFYLGSKVTASSIVRKYSEQFTYWNAMDMYKDVDYNLQSLIESIAVYSANDASVAIAEHLKGSENKFVNYMNERALLMGIDSTFYNVTGLNNNEVLNRDIYNELDEPEIEKDVLNELSAKEVALLSYKLVKDFPEVISYTALDEVQHPKIQNRIDYSSNGLLDDLKNEPNILPYPFEYPGVFGLMTGQMDKGEDTYYSYVNYYEQDADNKFITVVCTKSNHLEEELSRGDQIVRDDYDPYDRFRITTEILDYLKNYEKVIINNDRLTENSETLSIPVYKGKSKSVKYEISGEQYVYYDNPDQLEFSISIKQDDQFFNKNKLIAPLEKGTTIGQANIKVKNIDINYITENQEENLTYDIVLSEDVNRANIFKLIGIEISETITNFVDWIISLF
ncbi:D-alanyl-D-alanine carboxypeptidase family protein [Haloplasma contractile]|uniref:D-alanyl-D-alanine carboxypeptidase protein n=1 Tax=Haloplasma contractile SSD-17B TaxID=1033810 RepID=F7PWU1_9MOLU|nr:serine hydrolase [Haloplasma contractile]ERJ12532.1 D-alanyl-D-alanine carboxypeptidase protein [Haloplasma contractile SSD-17B]